jgi:hypothetical protein
MGNPSLFQLSWAERPKWAGALPKWLGQDPVDVAHSNSSISQFSFQFISIQVQISEIHRNLIIFDKIINLIS